MAAGLIEAPSDTGQGDPGDPVLSAPEASEPPAPQRRLLGFPVSPAWPLTALLVGFPVWWALGLSDFVFPIIAVPMLWQLRRFRPLRVPRGFAIWALFVVWVTLSVVMLSAHAPDTIAGSTGTRLFGFSLRWSNYLSQTVLLLWVGNMSERDLPRRRIVKMLGIFFLYAVAGGLLGVVAPHFSFTSPAEVVLPRSLSHNAAVLIYVHPAAAQVQSILGHASPRPKAPFDYTNVWGADTFVLGVFFILGWWTWGSRRTRAAVVPILLLALVPDIYSVDRGAWIGTGIALAYVGARLAMRGRVAVLGALFAGIAVVAVVILASPLHTIISERLAHPQSNTIRNSLSSDSYHDALSSPVLGYGSTRPTIGSAGSIAIGKTPGCPQCGNAAVGSNGSFWLTLFAQGFVGVTLYTLFFIVVLLRYVRDRSALGLAATAVIGVSLFFNFFYSGAGSPLTLYMIAVALLWRNAQAARQSLPGSPAQPDLVPA